MKSNSPQLRHGTTLLFVLPVLVAITGSANADPGKTQQSGVNTASFATNTIGTERTWHWKSDPEAYQPDGLSDYSEDFAMFGRQSNHQRAESAATPRRQALSQTGAQQAR